MEMTAAELTVVITSVAALLVATIGAFFAGMVQLRSLPKVHTLVNNRAERQDQKIAALEQLVSLKNADAIRLAYLALEKSEADHTRRDEREALESVTPKDVHVINPPDDPVNVKDEENPE